MPLPGRFLSNLPKIRDSISGIVVMGNVLSSIIGVFALNPVVVVKIDNQEWDLKPEFQADTTRVFNLSLSNIDKLIAFIGDDFIGQIYHSQDMGNNFITTQLQIGIVASLNATGFDISGRYWISYFDSTFDNFYIARSDAELSSWNILYSVSTLIFNPDTLGSNDVPTHVVFHKLDANKLFFVASPSGGIKDLLIAITTNGEDFYLSSVIDTLEDEANGDEWLYANGTWVGDRIVIIAKKIIIPPNPPGGGDEVTTTNIWYSDDFGASWVGPQNIFTTLYHIDDDTFTGPEETPGNAHIISSGDKVFVAFRNLIFGLPAILRSTNGEGSWDEFAASPDIVNAEPLGQNLILDIAATSKSDKLYILTDPSFFVSTIKKLWYLGNPNTVSPGDEIWNEDIGFTAITAGSGYDFFEIEILSAESFVRKPINRLPPRHES